MSSRSRLRKVCRAAPDIYVSAQSETNSSNGLEPDLKTIGLPDWISNLQAPVKLVGCPLLASKEGEEGQEA